MNDKLKKCICIQSAILCFWGIGQSSAFADGLQLPNGFADWLGNVFRYKSQLTAGLSTPITFYGRVVDQYGAPVPNARVDQEILTSSTNPFTFFNRVTVKHTRTDNDGNFTFTGNGRWIEIYCQPGDFTEYDFPGYYQNKKYDYGQGSSEEPRVTLHVPDANNPEIFHLRKKEGPPCLSIKFYCGDETASGIVYDPENDGNWIYSTWSNEYGWKQDTPTIMSYKKNREDKNLFVREISSTKPFLKSSVTRETVDENKKLFMLNLYFYGNVKVQQGNSKMFKAPESGYDSNTCSLLIKKEETRQGTDEYFVKLPDNTWQQINVIGNRPTIVLFAKMWNKYYAKMEVFWDIEYGLYYASIITFINTVEGNRIFENDYELARQLNGNRELSRNMTKEYFQNVQTAARIVYENGTLETKFNEAYNAYVAARAVYQNDATRENEKLMEKKLDVFYVFGPSCLPYLLNKMQSEPTEDKRLIDMFNRLLGHGSSYHRGAKYKNLSQCVAGWNFYSRYYQEMLDGTYKYRPYEEIMREEGHQ